MKTKNGNAKISIAVESPDGYETHSLLRRMINFLVWIPFLNLVPKSVGKFLFKKSRDAKEVKKNAASYKALEIIYDHDWRNFKGVGAKCFNLIWGSLGNVKAVRNRLKIVKRLVLAELHKIDNDGKINILSVGCGSARGVLETAGFFQNRFSQKNIKIVLADVSHDALEYAASVAKRCRLEKNATFIQENILNFEIKDLEKNKYDIIEMVGLLDYFKRYEAVEIISKLSAMLKPGGIFITANICPNPEQRFVTDVIDWPLIYREPEELASLLIEGDNFKKIRVIIEPVKIYAVALCEK